MRFVAILLAAAAASVAFASNAPDWVVGSYRLELSQDMKDTVKKLGGQEPYARIMLRPDSTFSYAANSNGSVSGASGTYQIEDHRIRLVASDEFPAQHVKSLSGMASDGSLEIDGLRYVKVGASVNLVGTWFVKSGEELNKSIKIVFGADRSFHFSGMAATSSGHYEVDGDRIKLSWTEVDGQSVQEGSMHKVLYVNEDGSFNVDTYKYVKN